MRYVEIKSLAKVIYKREIPQHFYKDMKLLNPNSGMTSLVFEKDKDTVRIFTKDDMKKEWLIHDWGLSLGNYIDTITDTKYKNIHIIDMPKLYPLSPENKKIVNEIMKAINKIGWYTPHDPYRRINNLYTEANKLKGKAKKILLEFYNFVTNYNPIHQYGIDIAKRNFMQTKRGKLVMLDPVADKELLKLYRGW